MKTGIMLVGLNGVNASTLIAGCTAMKFGLFQKQYGITESALFKNIDFLDIEDMTFSGWDYFQCSQLEMLNEYNVVHVNSSEKFELSLSSIKPYRGIHTDMDIILEDKFNHYTIPSSITEAITIIKNDIEDFRRSFALSDVIVIYLGSPSKKAQQQIKNLSINEFSDLPINMVPSGLLYAVASIKSKAHFADFTPSETLEFDFLNKLATENGVQLSGRDGSTGQTMLKLTLANMLMIKNLKLRGWYSTNILGNHDGYILSNPDYRETKIEDKMNCIAPLLGYDDFEHKVTIDYFRSRFDSKESWDSIDFSGWLNTPMTLKVNWQGEDAILSAPVLLDIVRLIDYGAKKGLSGFIKQLGLFYKHPFGCEGLSLETMFKNMIEFYTTL